MANRQPWPPEEWQPKYRKFHEHSAWYSGSRQKLMDHYSIKGEPTDGAGNFWGTKLKEGQSKTMVHVPIAGDMAGTSANLVLGSEPQLYIPEAHQKDPEENAKREEKRLEELKKKMRLYPRLVEACEGSASLGGIFLKVNWDSRFKDFPIINTVHTDHALPKWRWGFLQKVTFHRIVKTNEHKVWRHLEIHKPGVIINELYLGKRDELGEKVSLEQSEKTKPLEEKVSTGLDDLACVYIPNRLPNRLWRTSDLGQSDYQGIEDLMDSLDQVYSDWVHEIEIARGKILTSEEYLKNEKGEWIFDMDQSVFTPLEMAPTSEGSKIEPVQFKIRAEGYQKTAIELFDRIVSTAGYAPQSFGLNIEDRADTGTALRLRKKKSERTQEMKQNYFKSGLERALHLLMKIDAKQFNGSAEYQPAVEFDDTTEVDMRDMSEAVRNIDMASAASNETLVRLLHPDWDKEQVEQEVERINKESGIMVSEPDIRGEE